MADTKLVKAIRKRIRKAPITPDKLSEWKKQYDLEHYFTKGICDPILSRSRRLNETERLSSKQMRGPKEAI